MNLFHSSCVENDLIAWLVDNYHLLAICNFEFTARWSQEKDFRDDSTTILFFEENGIVAAC